MQTEPEPEDLAHLMAAWRILPPLERAILQVLSLTFDSVPRTYLTNAVRKLGLRLDERRALNSANIVGPLEELTRAGLLVPRSVNAACHPRLAGALVREALATGAFEGILRAIREAPIALSATAEIWLALHQGQFERAENLLRPHRAALPQRHPLWEIGHRGLDPAAIAAWPDALLADAMELALLDSLLHLTPAVADCALLERLVAGGRVHPRLRALLALLHALQGRGADADRCLAGLDTPQALAVAGLLALSRFDVVSAAAKLDDADRAMGADRQPRIGLIDHLTCLWRTIAHLHQNDFVGALGLLAEPAAALAPAWTAPLRASLKLAPSVGASRLQASDWQVRYEGRYSQFSLRSFDEAVRVLAAWWIEPASLKAARPTIDMLRDGLAECGFHWLAAAFEEMGARVATGASTAPSVLLDAMQASSPWQRSLAALERLLAKPVLPPPPPPPRKVTSDTRVAWLLDLTRDHVDIRPVEQKIQGARWSKGRPIALERLSREAARMSHLSAADLRVVSCITSQTSRNSGGYPETTHYFDTLRALDALVGHPCVFADSTDPQNQVELSEQPPALSVVEDGPEIVLAFVPQLQRGTEFAVARLSPTRLSLVRVPAALQPYLTAIGEGLRIPRAAKDQVTRLLGPLSSVVAVHSGVGRAADVVEERAANGEVFLQLRPHAGGLSVRALVRPLPGAELLLVAGVGAATVVVETDGRRVQLRRDLAEERRRAERGLDACPTLRAWPDTAGDRLISSHDACLELLLELQAAPELGVEWPGGGAWRVHPAVSARQLRWELRREAGGYRCLAAMTVGSGTALELPRLLDLVVSSPGRFVRLGEGEFVALTADFRRQLDDLAALADRRGEVVHLHPLALGVVADWMAEGPFVADADLRGYVDRIREAERMEFEVPSTFTGELREYQLDGFRWLMRLAHWGAGACLADDMGLGKTVQLLAMLLARAPGGAALVVAPTSVCSGWAAEALRFAPTLRCVVLTGRDRAATVAAAGAFDVVIVSYGLLVEEEALLAGRTWHTAVLDEAHAIKNASTRRSLAASALRSAFAVASTGTPVENHAGELWALFRFVNPGLLGTQDRFDARFTSPLAKTQDQAALQRLKRLVRPFILRRTKTQVLPELPPRTDVVRYVDLGAEEAALYEALRGRALSALAAGGAGTLQILVEIMKLRRACCHPRLVLPDAPVEGAKLAAFAELVDELRINGHKALVFSQFVDHLSILREHLDARHIAYQYLDGATPMSERKRRVDAFQSGSGDLFLISLRAGGLGLNLTAADYVLHMDPWWNPAVEEQASDRAHRLGQERPVTVYRLVTRHTIEEQILSLHARKRALAERLLEGVELGERVTADELLDLLRGA